MFFIDVYWDFRYFLNRGYLKKSVLKFVVDYYRFLLRDRYFLVRCVFFDVWIVEVRRKFLKFGEFEGKVLVVDGFNVFIIFEFVFDGEVIFCEDGLVRDLKYQGKYRLNERMWEVVEIVVELFFRLKVFKVIFFYGKNVLKSGIVRKIIEEVIEKYGLSGDVRFVKSLDFEFKVFSIVVMVDVGIIFRVEYVFDVFFYVLGRFGVEIRI